jgi:hypothetical protein
MIFSGAQPPHAAADEDEEGEDNGEGTQDFVFPKVERLTQRGQLFTEALDLELEVGVARGGVVKINIGFGREKLTCITQSTEKLGKPFSRSRGRRFGSWEPLDRLASVHRWVSELCKEHGFYAAAVRGVPSVSGRCFSV